MIITTVSKYYYYNILQLNTVLKVESVRIVLTLLKYFDT